MDLSPYEKSRAINYARGAASFKDENLAAIKTDYAKNMALSLEYEDDAIIDGQPQRIIAKKTKGNQRYSIQSAPDETFHAGSIVECYGSIWIIVEVEANKEVCTTGVMLRCNHLFRFQNGTSNIVERWGVLDTGVYSTTVRDTETQTILNKQYKIYLPLDEETRKLYIGKRIATSIMKDSSYNDVLVCWRTTEFDDSSENYGDDALLVLKCISDQYNPNTDSITERICNYISPQEDPDPPVTSFNAEITFAGDPIVRIGGQGKTFNAVYTTASGDPAVGVTSTWMLSSDTPSGVSLIPSGDTCKVLADTTVPDNEDFSLILKGVSNGASVITRINVETIGL